MSSKKQTGVALSEQLMERINNFVDSQINVISRVDGIIRS